MAGAMYQCRIFNWSWAYKGDLAILTQVAVTSKLGGKEAGKPTLLLTYKTDRIVSQVKERTGRKKT